MASKVTYSAPLSNNFEDQQSRLIPTLEHLKSLFQKSSIRCMASYDIEHIDPKQGRIPPRVISTSYEQPCLSASLHLAGLVQSDKNLEYRVKNLKRRKIDTDNFSTTCENYAKDLSAYEAWERLT